MQVFVLLFALLGAFAPALGAPLPRDGFHDSREYVSAPTDQRGDAASFESAALCVAEDLEEEADDGEADKANYLGQATPDCARGAGYRLADTSPPALRRLSAHLGTGPPNL